MREYIISFAGLYVAVRYDSEEVVAFLSFLFGDMQCSSVGDYEEVLLISRDENSGQYRLSTSTKVLFRGDLGVGFAAVLFDFVIFNLLNKNKNGISLHAGAVAYGEEVILLPGQSGSGKSTMSAWLCAHGFSYLTDELIFLPDHESGQVIPFIRPVCIKTGAISEIKRIIPEDNIFNYLEDEQGLVVPHRLLNPDFSIITSPPSLILFPEYQFESLPRINKISGAQTCACLMACAVNARNFEDHGFEKIVRIARSIPAYRVTYGCFNGMGDVLAYLIDELNWN